MKTFKEGDTVKLTLTTEKETNMGGWVDEMDKFVGASGVVIFTENAKDSLGIDRACVMVEFEGEVWCQYVFSPENLTLVTE